jgi:D-2-hydroxyacid dehydrogenase (NADP+)
MTIVIWLEHEISAFSVQPAQVAALEARFPWHDFQVVETEAAFLQALPEAAGALVWRFSAEWYALAPQLQFVATPAAGRENLAPDPSRRTRAVHGHFHGKIMAESLLAMMLYFSRRLDVCVADQRAHRYDRKAYDGARRLAGQQALIIGFGPLGRECARLLKAVGLRVVGLKRNANVDAAPADVVWPVERLHAILPEADHVILTLPSDTGTDHLISERELSLMRSTATLYNLGRGNAIDELALSQALERGDIAHAFLDVSQAEPLPSDSPLWQTRNLALMPHASAISSEYLDLWFEELGAVLQR